MLTKREADLLLRFDVEKPVQADFDDVQCLTGKHLLRFVSVSPYTWVLSQEGQLAQEAVKRERAKERREDKQEQREEKAETRNEAQAKFSVYGFYISIATLIVSVAGLVFSVWSFFN